MTTRAAAAGEERMLLVDISNSFTKLAVAEGGAIRRPSRVATQGLDAEFLREALGRTRARRVVVASVVPDASRRIRPALPKDSIFVGPHNAGGLRICYPRPETIGADRLANAAGFLAAHPPPGVVVDFGTAVTFDVIAADGAYIGGVIAPGLSLLTEYLHRRTALLPRITLRAPRRTVGRSTREAMCSGAVNGYRGLISEILGRIRAEEFTGQRATIVATGGDASLIGQALPLFDEIDPLLTLRGLEVIGRKRWGLQLGRKP